MSADFSEHEINNYREAFRLFDTEQNGHITLDGLKEVLETIGYSPSEDELLDRLMEINTAGNGVISFDEFMSVVALGKHDIEDHEMVTLFHTFDLDRSGYIYPEEMKIVLKRLGFVFTEKQVEAMIHYADSAGDGRICYEEFISANDVKIHKLKKREHAVALDTISDADITKYKEAFHLFDLEDTGHITLEEMKKVMSKLGFSMSEEDLKRRLKEIDRRGNGVINFDEFIAVAAERQHDEEEQAIICALKVFDTDADGYISKDGLSNGLKKLGFAFNEKQVEAMLHYADIHGDGKINYENFIKSNDFRLHKH